MYIYKYELTDEYAKLTRINDNSYMFQTIEAEYDSTNYYKIKAMITNGNFEHATYLFEDSLILQRIHTLLEGTNILYRGTEFFVDGVVINNELTNDIKWAIRNDQVFTVQCLVNYLVKIYAQGGVGFNARYYERIQADEAMTITVDGNVNILAGTYYVTVNPNHIEAIY